MSMVPYGINQLEASYPEIYTILKKIYENNGIKIKNDELAVVSNLQVYDILKKAYEDNNIQIKNDELAAYLSASCSKKLNSDLRIRINNLKEKINSNFSDKLYYILLNDLTMQDFIEDIDKELTPEQIKERYDPKEVLKQYLQDIGKKLQYLLDQETVNCKALGSYERIFVTEEVQKHFSEREADQIHIRHSQKFIELNKKYIEMIMWTFSLSLVVYVITLLSVAFFLN